MAIQLSPEAERLVEQEIASGRFRSVDEIIQQGIRNRNDAAQSEGWMKHRETIVWMRNFAENKALPLNGLSIKELIEEGRRM